MWNIHNTSYTTSDTLCTIYNTNGMTKYRKGPTKEHYTGPQRIGNTIKDPKGALHIGPQRIGNTIKDPKGLQWRITQGPDLQISYDNLTIIL